MQKNYCIEIDLTRLFDRVRRAAPSGIDRVLVEYLRYGLAQKDTAHFVAFDKDQLISVPRWKARLLARYYQQIWQPSINQPWSHRWVRLMRFFFKSPRRSQWFKRIWSPAVIESDERDRFLLNLSHKNWQNLEGLRQKRSSVRRRIALFIHDLIPLQPALCDVYPQEFRQDFEHSLRLAYRACDLLLVNSNYTHAQVQQWCKSHNLPWRRTAILPLGCRRVEISQKNESRGDPGSRDFFLILGSIHQRKNLRLIAEIWQGMHDPPRLILVGEQEDKALAEKLQQASAQISIFSGLNDHEVRKLLASCQALLMPSIYEGFGLPLIEAAQLNVPIICSETPLYREILGDIPEYLPADCANSWQKCLDSYRRQLSPRRNQINRLRGSQLQFGWDLHFQRLRRALAL